MNRIRLLVSSLLLMMILLCGACGKKGPPLLPQGHFSGSVSESAGEKALTHKP